MGSTFDGIRAKGWAFVAPPQCNKISTKSKFQDNYVIMNHRLLEEQRSTSDTFIVPSPPPLTQNICTKFGRGGGLPPWVALWLLMLLTNCGLLETTQSALSMLIVTYSFLWYLLHPPSGPVHYCTTFPSSVCKLISLSGLFILFLWFYKQSRLAVDWDKQGSQLGIWTL